MERLDGRLHNLGIRRPGSVGSVDRPQINPLTSCPALEASAGAVYVTFVLSGRCLLDTDGRLRVIRAKN